LSGARRTYDQRAGALFEATSKQRVELRDITRELRVRGGLPVFGGNEPWEHLDPAAVDDVVVIPAAKLHAAVLHDTQAPSLGAEIRIQLVEEDDAVGDALYLQVSFDRREVVQ